MTAGDVYSYILQFEREMSGITDQFNFAQKIYKNIFKRFSETCDSITAILSFILTKDGREWWKDKLEQRNSELNSLMTNPNL